MENKKDKTDVVLFIIFIICFAIYHMFNTQLFYMFKELQYFLSHKDGLIVDQTTYHLFLVSTISLILICFDFFIFKSYETNTKMNPSTLKIIYIIGLIFFLIMSLCSATETISVNNNGISKYSLFSGSKEYTFNDIKFIDCYIEHGNKGSKTPKIEVKLKDNSTINLNIYLKNEVLLNSVCSNQSEKTITEEFYTYYKKTFDDSPELKKFYLTNFKTIE